MYYYHSFANFMHTPEEYITLREFIEKDCYLRAKAIEQMIEKDNSHVHVDYELIKAMPVNFCTTVPNYSLKKHKLTAPPIVFERLGYKVVTDEEYSFYGTFGDFLVKLSRMQYDWIGELVHGQWAIIAPDLIVYDNYSDAGGDLEDDEEEHFCPKIEVNQ